MRSVVQRVSSARVVVEGEGTGEIGAGLLVLLGVCRSDTERDADYLVEKTIGLRIFEDEQGKMNRSVQDIGGSILVVSQFTLCGDARKGRRPSFMQAADPKKGNQLYEHYVQRARTAGVHVETGRFQTTMDVTLTNHGPVTILLDSEKLF